MELKGKLNLKEKSAIKEFKGMLERKLAGEKLSMFEEWALEKTFGKGYDPKKLLNVAKIEIKNTNWKYKD